jgi:tetratricopeptide (TPR) repeat protein
MKTLIALVLFSGFYNTLFSQNVNPTAQQIYEKSQNSVVFIVTYDENGALKSYGSGVIISEDGLIYTNYHVIAGYDRIEIRNGKTVYTQIVITGFNPLFDAAVLKISTDSKFTDYIKTNESIPTIGEVVYALGNPQGYTKTLSEGLVSGIREVEGNNQIQITASISPGSSGGALFNSYGELIAITCSTNTQGQSLNFAHPIRYFNNIAPIDHNDTLQIKNMQLLFDVYNNKGTYDEYRRFESIQSYLANTNTNVNSYILASEIFKKFSRNDSAAVYLSKAIELDPSNKLLFKLRGDAYGMTTESDSAIADYNIAISMDSDFIEAYIGRALLYEISLDDYRKAASDYTKVISIDPDYSYLYTYRSNCFLSLGDTTRALQDLNKSLGFDQKFDYIYFKRAQLYTDLNMFEEAIRDYTEAIKLNPNEPNYYFERAILYSKTGQNILAIEDYKTYSKYHEDYDFAYNNMAYSYMADSDYVNAEKYFNKSLSVNPGHLDSYLGLAIMNHRLGNIKETVKFMYKAMKLESLLNYGMKGIEELEKKNWFWDVGEKADMKEIFKIMGVDSRDVVKKTHKVKAKNAN